jgi:hypothetical protein
LRSKANGNTQRSYVDMDEAASPIVVTDSIIIASVNDAKENRDVITADVPNAFVKTNIVTKQRGERIIMKILGPLVKMLTEIHPDLYAPFVVNEGKGEVLCVMILKALYGILQSSLLYYKNSARILKTSDLRSIHMILVWPMK